MAPNKENLAAVLLKANDLRVMNRPMPPACRPNDVLLRVSRVGICGTDVSFYTKGKMGEFEVKDPFVLGHESAGTVVECGSDVTTLKPGDRVAIAPNMPCRRCQFCVAGQWNLCKSITKGFMASDKGSLCQYYRHPVDYCYKLPDHVSLEEGAFLEPLSCAVHSVRRAGVTLGTRLLICGAGPIGILSMMVARSMGATHICLTDLNEKRLELAKELGADSVVQVTREASLAQLVDVIKEKMGGRQPNITMDCSGAEASIKLAIQATESGGNVTLVGLGPAEVKVPLVDAAIREVDIRGVFCYVNDFADALDLVASGRANVKALITHRYTLAESVEAFETLRTGAGGAMKVMISVD